MTPFGVIESFQNAAFDLHKNFHDFTFLLSKVGMVKLSQGCTGRGVKILKIIEPWFAYFNEDKLRQGKRDRCMQELWICENSISLAKLPLEDYEKE